MNRIIQRTLGLLVFFGVCHLTLAADEQALTIIRQVDANNKSTTSQMLLSMSVSSSDGGRAREFSIRSYENEAGSSLIEFTEPRSVQGMRILSIEKSSWVFFPSTGRIRRIAGASRSGSVQGVGGDFSYDDLGTATWEADYEWKLLEENQDSWSLEGIRKNRDAAYDQIRMTVDKTLIRPVLCLFALDSEGGYFKRLELSDFKTFTGNIRPGKMLMKNLNKNSYTEVLLREAAFDINLDSHLFDTARFSR